MHRNCLEIETGERIKLYVDEKNAEQILSYIEQDERHRKKYKHIKNAILRGVAPRSIYEKIKTTKDVWEIKFFPNVKGKNDRIYCRQFDSDKTAIIIVMVELYQGKKSQKINKKIQTRIDLIKDYEYDIK